MVKIVNNTVTVEISNEETGDTRLMVLTVPDNVINRLVQEEIWAQTVWPDFVKSLEDIVDGLF